MSRKQWVPQNEMNTFTENVNRLDADDAEDVFADLEENYLRNDDEVNEPPTSVPVVTRKRMRAIIKQINALSREYNGINEMLCVEAGKIYERKERQDEKKKPKCECCGAVLVPKKKR